jgi:hypothetical protein
MSFREKSAWVCLVSTLVVFVPYFLMVAIIDMAGALKMGAIVGLLIAAIFVQGAIAAAAMIAVAIHSGADNADERDRAVDLLSFRNGYFVLSVSLVSAICVMVFAPPAWAAHLTVPLASQVFFGCFVAAEVVKYATQVVCYRRGF